MSQRRKLGEILLEEGATTPDVIKHALGHQRQWGGKLGRILVEMGAIAEEQLTRALAIQARMPTAKLKQTIAREIASLLPPELAERYQALVFGVRESDSGETFYVAVPDPYDMAAMDAVRFRLGKQVKFALAPADEIARLISTCVRGEPGASEDLDLFAIAPKASLQVADPSSDLRMPAAANARPPANPLDELLGLDPLTAASEGLSFDLDELLGANVPAAKSVLDDLFMPPAVAHEEASPLGKGIAVTKFVPQAMPAVPVAVASGQAAATPPTLGTVTGTLVGEQELSPLFELGTEDIAEAPAAELELTLDDAEQPAAEQEVSSERIELALAADQAAELGDVRTDTGLELPDDDGPMLLESPEAIAGGWDAQAFAPAGQPEASVEAAPASIPGASSEPDPSAWFDETGLEPSSVDGSDSLFGEPGQDFSIEPESEQTAEITQEPPVDAFDVEAASAVVNASDAVLDGSPEPSAITSEAEAGGIEASAEVEAEDDEIEVDFDFDDGAESTDTAAAELQDAAPEPAGEVATASAEASSAQLDEAATSQGVMSQELADDGASTATEADAAPGALDGLQETDFELVAEGEVGAHAESDRAEVELDAGFDQAIEAPAEPVENGDSATLFDSGDLDSFAIAPKDDELEDALGLLSDLSVPDSSGGEDASDSEDADSASELAAEEVSRGSDVIVEDDVTPPFSGIDLTEELAALQAATAADDSLASTEPAVEAAADIETNEPFDDGVRPAFDGIDLVAELASGELTETVEAPLASIAGEADPESGSVSAAAFEDDVRPPFDGIDLSAELAAVGSASTPVERDPEPASDAPLTANADPVQLLLESLGRLARGEESAEDRQRLPPERMVAIALELMIERGWISAEELVAKLR